MLLSYTHVPSLGFQVSRRAAPIMQFAKNPGKSKYGVPFYLENGNVNPAYLAAERKEKEANRKKNFGAYEAKRKNLVKNKKFELADFIRDNIGSAKNTEKNGRWSGLDFFSD